jgi:hypothetical protein
MSELYDLHKASGIYVIGDIHRRLDLLDPLVGKIDVDIKQVPPGGRASAGS